VIIQPRPFASSASSSEAENVVEKGSRRAHLDFARCCSNRTEGRFADHAVRLAGAVGALLGWRPEEFWSATPAELVVIFQVLAGDGEQGVSAGSADLARLQEMFPDG